jgi:hypothetical protein
VGEGWGEGIRPHKKVARPFVIFFFLFSLISKNSFPSSPAGVMVGEFFDQSLKIKR